MYSQFMMHGQKNIKASAMFKSVPHSIGYFERADEVPGRVFFMGLFKVSSWFCLSVFNYGSL